jgi:hypothetical protein
MNGSLEWYTFIGHEAVYLGKREVPVSLEEGDAWTNELGDKSKVMEALSCWSSKPNRPKNTGNAFPDLFKTLGST